MGNVVSKAGVHIAGPRRPRGAPPLPVAAQPSVVVGEVRASAPPPLPARALPALDYDEPTATRLPSMSDAEAARVVEPRPRSSRWFAIGLVVGVVVFTFARGGVVENIHAARLWGANALRAMKKTQPTARCLPPGTLPTHVEAAPCTINDINDDDYAVLMAPFIQAEAEAAAKLAAIPTFDVGDLPKARPPVVYVPPVPKPLDLAAPVAQPEIAEPAGGAAPTEEPTPRPSRAPGPFDAPGPVGPSFVAQGTPLP
jgi:hypothetical protein